MVRLRDCLVMAVLCGGLVGFSGCTTSTAPVPAGTGGATAATGTGSKSATTSGDHQAATGDAATTKERATWDDYPDVPKYEVMTEVDGIKIPRLKTSGETLGLTGKITADVGNPRAKSPAGEAVDGDWVTVRFNAEPKVLNPLTSSDAVKSYIMQYVNEPLARQNPESFEYEPHIADKWVIEDSIKLSPDYPGKERRVGGDGRPAAASLEIDYQLPVAAADGTKPNSPPLIALTTTNSSGQSVGGVWVGAFPVGRVAGASVTGYHFWSDSSGQVKVGGFPAGKYLVKVGAEIFGQSVAQPNGTLAVIPATSENPLVEELKSSGSQ